MATVQELLRRALELPGDSARRDAEILLGHCLGRPRAWLYSWPESDVPEVQERQYQRLLTRRREGTPVAYLTGQRDFWSLQLQVDEHTLIPRPETETLVEWALQLALPQDAAVLDLGTGCGAIALAVASERPHWRVVAVDASAQALRLAQLNARHTGLEQVRFEQSNWYQAVAAERFHLLLSNPPYIDSDDGHLLQGDVRFEPRSALVATQAGLADLARLARGAPAQLHPGGWIVLEHGSGQGAAVRALLCEAGFGQVATRRDLAGLERVTGGCLNAQ